jgi:hypothetical protein
MVFFMEITNIWQKSSYLIFKFTGWHGFSYGFLVVSDMFHQCFLKFISNPKFYQCCFVTDDLQKHFCIIGWYHVRQRKPKASEREHDLYSLAKFLYSLL